MTIVYLVLLFVTSITANVFHGFSSLENGAGKKTHSFTHEDNQKFLNFHYNIEHSHDVVITLDLLDSIKSVVCYENELDITFHSSEALNNLNLKQGAIITGGIKWSCDKNAPIFLRRALDFVWQGKRIFIKTENITYTDIFNNAKISFTTNKYPSDHFHSMTPSSVPAYEDEEVIHDHKRNINSIGDFFKRVWNSAKSMVNTVYGVVSEIIGISKGVLGIADYDLSSSKKMDLLSFNYNNITRRAESTLLSDDGEVICGNCYFFFDLSLTFELQITKASVEHFKVVLDGNAEITVMGTFNYTLSTVKKTKAWSKLVSQIVGKPVVFFVAGIPFAVNIKMPVLLGFDVEADIGGEVVAMSRATGKISYGMVYNNITGIKWINDNQLQKNGTIGRFNPTVQTNGMLYLLPTAVVLVDFIGGPYFGLKPYLEAVIDSNSYGCNESSLINLNWGLQVTMGASIHIAFPGVVLYDKVTKPTIVYNLKYPLSGGCYSPMGLISGPLLPGNVWSGNQTYIINSNNTKCKPFPNSVVSFQLISYESDKIAYFIGSTENDGTFYQSLYKGTATSPLDVKLEPVTDSSGEDVYFDRCDSECNPPISKHNFIGSSWDDFTEINYNGCYMISLKRVSK